MTATSSPSRTLTTGKIASPERWQLAARRARTEGITVRQVNDTGQWIATSGSSKIKAYTLKIVNGMVMSCSCEAAAMWGDPCCKHRAAYYLSTGRIELDAPAAGGGE